MSDGRLERETVSRKGDVRAHREELQRVQIGLVGLAAVLLVVTLANLIVDTVRQDSGSETAGVSADVPSATLPSSGSNSSGMAPNNEPLADLGVTPSTSDSTTPILPSPVPDLEPDPQLRQRMDQDREPTQSQPQQTP